MKRKYVTRRPGPFLPSAFAFLLILGCAQPPAKAVAHVGPGTFAYEYVVDLNDGASGVFKVELAIRGLGPRNNVFNFAAVGSYARMDFGRFVKRFQAFDGVGNALAVSHISTNRWQLSQPTQVRRIEYDIAETWGSRVPGAEIAEMIGTALDPGFAFINGQGLFGFIDGYDRAPMRVRFKHPPAWQIGTALPVASDGAIVAPAFGAVASAPILAGYITSFTERILGMEVFVYCYSRNDNILAVDLQPMIKGVFEASYKFLGYLPIDRYTMSFVFDLPDAGGVQYRNSSAFVFAEAPFEEIRQRIQDTVTHEFFHLVIPFAIRSDALDKFNFFQPRTTGHYWFFEGVTEWASDIIQLRSNLKSLQDYFIYDFRQKLVREDLFGAEISLHEISLNVHARPEEYLSVYSRGALAATLLDIHLLDLSKGKRGLREVINDLARDFGPQKPLPEEQFFNILMSYSGPEFEPFIQRYIVGNEPLPVAAMLEKIGIIYTEEELTPEPEADPGMYFAVDDGRVQVIRVDKAQRPLGVQVGDVVTAFNDRPMTPEWLENSFPRFVSAMDIGEPFSLAVLHEGNPRTVEGRMIHKKIRHLLSVPRMLTPAQQRTREAWLRNLP